MTVIEQQNKFKDKKNNKLVNWTPYLLILPSIIFIAAFLVYPIGTVFYYSFQNYNITAPFYDGFAGLDNYIKIFTEDRVFVKSLIISVQWVIAQVGLQLVIGMGFALLLNQSFKFRGAVRSIVFLPWAISGVLASTMWLLVLNENMGVLNDLLLKLSLTKEPISFLSGNISAFLSVIVAELWRGVPFFAITLLAGLQNVSKELYEAAKVDGAGRWKSFINITLPQLKEIIVLTTILRVAWEFNNVDLIYNLTGGGPANATTTLAVYSTNIAITGNEFGYGSALVVIAFFILLIFSIIYLKLSQFAKE